MFDGGVTPRPGVLLIYVDVLRDITVLRSLHGPHLLPWGHVPLGRSPVTGAAALESSLPSGLLDGQ
jgi:hypothetical protein